MSDFNGVLELAENVDKNFNEGRAILRDLVKNGTKPAEYQTRVIEVINHLDKETSDIQEEIDFMLEKSREISESIAVRRCDEKRIQYFLSQVERKAETEGQYTVFSQQLLDESLPLPTSPSPQVPDENAVGKSMKSLMLAAQTETPREVLRSIQSTSAPRSALKNRSAKKSAQKNQIPDWATQMSDVAFTPGLFPKGPSVKSLSKSEPRSEKKHVTYAKHLNF